MLTFKDAPVTDNHQVFVKRECTTAELFDLAYAFEKLGCKFAVASHDAWLGPEPVAMARASHSTLWIWR
jgi:hypothetical protein